MQLNFWTQNPITSALWISNLTVKKSKLISHWCLNQVECHLWGWPGNQLYIKRLTQCSIFHGLYSNHFVCLKTRSDTRSLYFTPIQNLNSIDLWFIIASKPNILKLYSRWGALQKFERKPANLGLLLDRAVAIHCNRFVKIFCSNQCSLNRFSSPHELDLNCNCELFPAYIMCEMFEIPIFGTDIIFGGRFWGTIMKLFWKQLIW